MDRPTLIDEIEITPEMVEAGVACLLASTLNAELPTDSVELRQCVADTYSAMLAASLTISR
jgi:hypothetical protein